MCYNESMSEDNAIKIVVGLITLFGTLIGVFVGYLSKSKRQSVKDAQHEQLQNDRFDKLFSDMDAIKKRLDTHNKYAEKFGDIEKSIIAIKKDIEYIRKDHNG